MRTTSEMPISAYRRTASRKVARRSAVEADGEPGTPMTVNFELEGQEFIALNGGPHFQFTTTVDRAVRAELAQPTLFFVGLSMGVEF